MVFGLAVRVYNFTRLCPKQGQNLSYKQGMVLRAETAETVHYMVINQHLIISCFLDENAFVVGIL